MVSPWSALTFTSFLIIFSLPTHLSSLQTKSTGIQLLLSETETYWKSAFIKDLADQEHRYTASTFWNRDLLEESIYLRSCRTRAQVYIQSKFTTLVLGQSGRSAHVYKFGMLYIYCVCVWDLSLSVLSFLSLQLWDVVFCVCGGSKFVSLIQWTWIMRRALVYSKPYLHVCIYSTECYRVDFKESFRIFWYSVV